MRKVNLTITYEQAEALVAVLGRVGGSTRTSRRALLEPIFVALEIAGLKYVPSTDSRHDTSGVITFKDIQRPESFGPDLDIVAVPQ